MDVDVKDIKLRKEYMKKKFGITTLQQLRQESKKLQLNIGVFITPPAPRTAKP